MIIGIIGAQGKFGAALYERLRIIKPKEVELLITTNKLNNKEIALKSDVVIVTVRPNQVVSLLKEVSPMLKSNAQVISFVGNYPLHLISKQIDRPVVRGMSDPWWNIAAFFFDSRFREDHVSFIFNNLVELPILRLKNDSDMDEFTIAISYLFVVLLVHKSVGIENFEKHIEYLSAVLKIKKEELLSCTPAGNVVEQLTRICTKDGISEKISDILRTNTDIQPEELYAIITKSLA